MREDFNAFLYLLGRDLKLDLPADVTEEAYIKSQKELRDLVQAVRAYWPNRDWLLSLSQLLTWDVDRHGSEAVVFYASREPGSSNEAKAPQEARVPLTRHEIVAATVIASQAKEDGQGSIVYEDAIRNLVAYCEDQLINGDGSKLTGLLRLSDATSITKSIQESREDFYCRTIEEYTSITGRKPTHIVISHSERLKWQAEKGVGCAAQEFPRDLREVPIIALDFVPEGRGLVLAFDDFLLVSSLWEWKFGCKDDELSARGQSQIIVSFAMGLAIKHPKAILQLQLVEEQERKPGSVRIEQRRTRRKDTGRKITETD